MTNWLLSAALLVAGALLGLFGLFAIAYSGDSRQGGDIYVRFGEDKIDADVVGVIALLLASLLVVVAIVWLKRSKR
jgi:drug/metabolite transporter (DMT)-like permease